MIPQNMRSVTEIIIDEIDLTAMKDVVARVKQGNTILLEIPLTIINAHKALLPLSRTEAEQLSEKKALEIQILWSNENGMPNHSDIKYVSIDRVLGGGYGG